MPVVVRLNTDANSMPIGKPMQTPRQSSKPPNMGNNYKTW